MLRYHYFTTESEAIPKLYSIGFASDPSVTRYGPARRNQYLIHYILSGKGTFNGTVLGRGDGFITTPGMFENYYPDESDPWTYVWIISYDPKLEGFIEMHNPNPDTCTFKFRNAHIADGVAKRLFSESGFALSIAQITEMYLSIFNNCVYSGSDSKTTNAKMYVDYSVKYISSNLHLPISVGDICKKLGVSQSYLYTVFRSELGLSPKQYILGCRLESAKKQLTETNFTVSEIAASVGYADVLAFSKFFSGRSGFSPTEWRRKVQSH